MRDVRPCERVKNVLRLDADTDAAPGDALARGFHGGSFTSAKGAQVNG